jgi:tetrahydromethanopterin S-methyltransferase subunit F
VVVGLSILAGGLFVSAAAIGTAIWCIGFAWILMGWRDLLVGRDATLTIGTVAALFGVTMIPASAGLWIWLATSAALIGVSVALRQGPMLGLGGIGLFVSTTLTIQHYVQGTTGVAIGLLVAGIAMLVLALLVSRLQPTRWHLARTPRRRARSTLHRSGPVSGRGSGWDRGAPPRTQQEVRPSEIYDMLGLHGKVSLPQSVNWSKTKAFTTIRSTGEGVSINLGGREIDGVVDPGDYEKVRDEVMGRVRGLRRRSRRDGGAPPGPGLHRVVAMRSRYVRLITSVKMSVWPSGLPGEFRPSVHTGYRSGPPAAIPL